MLNQRENPKRHAWIEISQNRQLTRNLSIKSTIEPSTIYADDEICRTLRVMFVCFDENSRRMREHRERYQWSHIRFEHAGCFVSITKHSMNRACTRLNNVSQPVISFQISVYVLKFVFRRNRFEWFCEQIFNYQKWKGKKNCIKIRSNEEKRTKETHEKFHSLRWTTRST